MSKSNLNFSTSNTTQFSIFENMWIPSQALTIFNFVFCVWSTAALFRFGYSNLKNSNKDFQSFVLLFLSVLTPFITCLKVMCTQAIIIVGRIFAEDEKKGQYICEFVTDLTVVLYYMSNLPIYLFLWARQRILYSQSSLKPLNTKAVKFLSTFAIFLLVIVGIVIIVLLVVPKSYLMSDYGCIRNSEENTNEIMRYIAISIMVKSQVIIFALFVYPLNHYKNKTGSGDKNSLKMNNRLKRATKLATGSLVLCSFSDLCALALTSIILPDTTPRDFTGVIFDLGLCVNIISLFVSLEKFSFTVFVKCKTVKKKLSNQSKDLGSRTEKFTATKTN